MGDPITYAKVGGPPAGWSGLIIIDMSTGAEVPDVIEVSAVEGWLVRANRDEQGCIYADPDKPDEVATERLVGSFEIRRPAQLAA